MYRFNLESLLNYRHYQEEILQKELADFKNQLVQQEQQMRQLKQAWRKNSLELRQRQKSGGKRALETSCTRGHVVTGVLARVFSGALGLVQLLYV